MIKVMVEVWTVIYIVFITIAFFVVAVKFFLINVRIRRLIHDNEYLSKQNQMQNEYNVVFDEYQQELRKVKHDISNHLYTIELMLENKMESEGKNYAKEVKNKFKLKQISYCENRVVDAVLYNKVSLAEESDIKVDVNVALEKELPFEQVDLTCVFSNILDNAIEACLKCKISERFIQLYVDKKNGQLVIKCINSCVGGIKIGKDYMVRSSKSMQSKKDMLSHGLGMKLIKETAEKYNGSIYCEEEGGIFTEIVRLEMDRALK